MNRTRVTVDMAEGSVGVAPLSGDVEDLGGYPWGRYETVWMDN